MSWLARSFVNSLGLDPDSEDEDADGHPTTKAKTERSADEAAAASAAAAAADDDDGEEEEEEEEEGGEQNPGRGVKEDISELTETLTRQLSGVASFLSLPAQPADHPPEIPTFPADSRPSGSDRSCQQDASDSRCGYLPIEEEEEESGGGVIGLTEDVWAFARNISMHPETWLDCPLLPDEDEPDDFEMSTAQQEHALAIEYLVPRLAALRIELCPVHMSEGCFWKIYFVLLHPRLHKDDAEHLSTPQIVEARAMMLQEQQNRMKSEIDRFGRTTFYKESITLAPATEQHQSSGGIPDAVLKTQSIEESVPSMSTTEFEIEKHPTMTTEIKIVDKVAAKEWQPESAETCNALTKSYEDEEDDAWLADDDDVIEMNASGATFVQIDDEDISFSDLEDSD